MAKRSTDEPTDQKITQVPKDGLDSHAGRPDQDVKNTLGPGAGGATEWGGGNKNHPSRIKSRPPGG